VRGGPKLGRLENLLNHFDTIHLSNKKKKKSFNWGVPFAGGGGWGDGRHFLKSALIAVHTHTSERKKEKCFRIFFSILDLECHKSLLILLRHH